jgi:hypothetical protein
MNISNFSHFVPMGLGLSFGDYITYILSLTGLIIAKIRVPLGMKCSTLQKG